MLLRLTVSALFIEGVVVCDNYNVSWVNGNDKLVVETAHVEVIRKNFGSVRPMI